MPGFIVLMGLAGLVGIVAVKFFWPVEEDPSPPRPKNPLTLPPPTPQADAPSVVVPAPSIPPMESPIEVERLSEDETIQPVVPPELAVNAQGVLCMICGQRAKRMSTHLKQLHDMDTTAYRIRFKLPDDYPLEVPPVARSGKKRRRGS